jgi:hypothetical protein
LIVGIEHDRFLPDFSLFRGSFLSTSSPVQHDLTTLTRQHRVESLLEVGVVEAVRDDRLDVQAALQHHCHFVPRLVHFATINSLDGQHVEDDDIPIDRDLFFGDPQHRDLAAVSHIRDQAVEGGRIAGHLQTDIETFPHSEFLLHFFQRRFTRINRNRGTHLLSQSESIRIQIGDDDVTSPRMPNDRGGHHADRSGSGNQDILAEDVKAESRMDRVPEGVEDRGDFLIDIGSVMPDVGHRQRQILGERTRAVDSNTFGVSTSGGDLPGNCGRCHRPRGLHR